MGRYTGSQGLRLRIIGTAHVDTSSVERVRKIISETRPSVVAVELDAARLSALKDPNREKLDSPTRSGLLPWLLALLERSAGSLTQVFPGSEMLEAVEEAQNVNAQIVMIDLPIEAILEDLRSIPLAERFKIGFDALVALLGMGTRRGLTQLASEDLHGLMEEFDRKYPTLFRILVTERDRYMADKLQEILDSTTGQIVAVVGLGHVNGITQNLAENQEPQGGNHLELNYEWTTETFPW